MERINSINWVKLASTSMTVLDFTDRQKDISFSGIEHRLFIEGRGFDFRTFEISHF